MDVAGFTFSIVSIASLFQTCVQLFDLFNLGREHGRDYEILSCKLEIERVRLLRWGEGVGLLRRLDSEAGITTDTGGSSVIDPGLQSSVDSRLGQHQIGPLVLYILSCLKLVFEDTERLEKRYGLKRENASTRTRTVNELVPSSDTTFKRVYDRLQNLTRERQSSRTFLGKTRWAIVDRMKFRNLVEDIKSFNDSLFALLPNVSNKTPHAVQEHTRFSKNILDPENLRSSPQSFILLPARAGGLLLELAAQFENLGFKSAGSAQLNDEEHLNRELDEELAKRNPGGILRSTYYRNGSSLGEESGGYRFKNSRLERLFVSSPSFPHPALGTYLIHALPLTQTASGYTRNLNLEHCRNFDNFDIETHPHYDGQIPGTITVIGYSKACDKYLKSLQSESRTVVRSHRPPAKFPVKYLLDRITDLKNGSSRSGIDIAYYCGLKGYPGFESTVVNNRSVEQLKFQTSSLCSWLNSPSFTDFSRIRSITLAALASPPNGIGLARFMHQILLGYDLFLRLQKAEHAWCNGITEKVWANILISKLWIENVDIVSKGNEFKLESHVHESQIEGLLKFAEILEWPSIAETRNYAENVYSKLRAGQNVPSDLLDWLFGVVMPGRLFAAKVMTALVLATPNLKALGAAPCSQCGLVVLGRSYWRSSTVVGKVLGGIKGVKQVAGWIGPCPPPHDETVTGWVKVQARGVAFLNPKCLGSAQPGVEREPERCPTQRHIPDDFKQYIAEIKDSSKWLVPPPPHSSTQKCALKSIQMKRLPSCEKQDSVTEYQVSLQFDIDTVSTTYTLYSNPMFITTLPCSGGPHTSHSLEIHNFKNVWDVADLNSAPATYNGILIIVATCNDGEIVGRAWCSERGKHALVRHKETCFACSVAMTTVFGLSIDVLIWT